MGKRQSPYAWHEHYTHKVSSTGQHRLGFSRFPSWLSAFLYRPRHRGVYKHWPVKTAEPILLGESHITIYPQLQGLSTNAQEKLNDMLSIRAPHPDQYWTATRLEELRTKRDVPWIIPRD